MDGLDGLMEWIDGLIDGLDGKDMKGPRSDPSREAAGIRPLVLSCPFHPPPIHQSIHPTNPSIQSINPSNPSIHPIHQSNPSIQSINPINQSIQPIHDFQEKQTFWPRNFLFLIFQFFGLASKPFFPGSLHLEGGE